MLSNVYYMMGDVDSALELNIQLLENRWKILGETNMETLESYSMTEVMYFHANQYKKAK